MADVADTLARIFTDPTHASNRLKRPATRTCLNCGATWKSRIALLADRLHCTPACETEYTERWAGFLTGQSWPEAKED